MHRGFPASALAVAIIIIAVPHSHAQEPIPYGAPIKLESALKLVAAAEAEARKNHWPVAVTVVDSAGFLVAFHRLDNTQLGSIEVSLQKAKTSALFRRPSKYFEDSIAQGGAGLRALRTGVMPVEGGLPIIQDGKLIGAIGVSGAKPSEDGQVARAGLAALEGGAKP
jgi:glc operon protein GlcG